MRLFKRHLTDPSPQLVSATSIPQDESQYESQYSQSSENDTKIVIANNADESGEGNKMPAPSTIISTRKSISTWGKKVGRKWDQLKRSDSSELLSMSGRRHRWSPNRTVPCRPMDEKEKVETGLPKSKRISRVESLRNLFRVTERSNRNNDSHNTAIRQDEAASSNFYAMEKALSEGALRTFGELRNPGKTKIHTLDERKYQLSRAITNLQEQQLVLDYILANKNILKTPEGTNLARETLTKVKNGVSELQHQTSDNGSGVSRNLFLSHSNNNENDRGRHRRSFFGSGIEDLLCNMRLAGCDESGYDSDSTRAGADSPDSGQLSTIPNRQSRSFSITSEDYQGIDLSLEAITPNNECEADDRGLKTPPGYIRNPEYIDENLLDVSVNTDITVVLDHDDDTDSCDDTTIQTLTSSGMTVRFEEKLSPSHNNDFANRHGHVMLSSPRTRARKIPRQNQAIESHIHRTPTKRLLSPNIDTMPLARRVKLQNLQKSSKTHFKLKGRKVSNSSAMNLLENAASPSKDSPPAKKINPISFNENIQYYSPKRNRSKMESDSLDNSLTISNSVKRPPVTIVSPPLAKPKVSTRRELKTVKIFVETQGTLGLFVERQAAARPFYVISKIDESGEAAKSKQFRIGDEIVRVSGRRLRGMTTVEARNALRSCVGTIEFQIAREPPFNFHGELGDTWSDGLVRTRSDSDVWTLKNEEPVSSTNSTKTESSTLNFHADGSNFSNCTAIGTLRKNVNTVSVDGINDCAFNNVTYGQDNSLKVTGMKKFQVIKKRNPVPATPARRTTSLSMECISVTFEKGASKKLGFSIVGGSDSSKGSIGIFVKDIMSDGQAAMAGILRVGDEILAINGQAMDGLTHAQALQMFKAAKPGKMILHIGRRDPSHKRSIFGLVH